MTINMILCSIGICSTLGWKWAHFWEAVLSPGVLLPWGLVLSALPAYLVSSPYSALYEGRTKFASSYLQRFRARAGDAESVKNQGSEILDRDGQDALTRTRRSAVSLAICCVAGFVALQLIAFQDAEPADTHGGFLPMFSTPWVRLAGLGFLGAYSNVLATVAVRLRTRDPSLAVLSTLARTLVAGPVLGALVMYLPLKVPEPPDTNMTAELVAFLVGAFPGLADRYLARLAAKLFGDGRQAVALRPLEHLSGMTLEAADRLAEEGIADAQHLASCYPISLYMRVPFHFRQVLDWMDEAILYRSVEPAVFANRTKAGITGAIDFVRRWEVLGGRTLRKVADPPDGTVPVGDELVALENWRAWKVLAGNLGFDEDDYPIALQVAELLSEDAQVSMVWGLYNALEAGQTVTDRR